MKEYLVEIEVDDDMLIEQSGLDEGCVEDQIEIEFGWLQQSGIIFKSIKPIEQ